MPPEGYTTVTLPDELVAQLDDHANAIGALSRADAVRSLFDGYETSVSARVVEIENDVIEDIAGRVAASTADELEERLR